MSDRTTIKKLRILSARLNRVAPNINSGGCGVIASLVAPHISMYYPTIVRAFDDDEVVDLNKIRPTVKGKTLTSWNSKNVHLGHIMLEIMVDGTSYYYDTNGLYKNKPPKKLGNCVLFPHIGFLTYEEVRTISSYKSGWNTRFDRQRIPALKNCVDQFFLNSISLSLNTLRSHDKKIQSLVDITPN